MNAFGAFQEELVLSSRSSCPSLAHSDGTGSFSSWDSITRPPSAQWAPPDPVNFENITFSTPHIPEEYGMVDSMTSISSTAFEAFPRHIEHSLLLPEEKMTHGNALVDFNNLPPFPSLSNEHVGLIHPSCLLRVQTPDLEIELSTPVSIDFSVPSQSTFSNSFGLQSPVLALHFNSSTSDYNLDLFLDPPPVETVDSIPYLQDSKLGAAPPSRAAMTTSQAPVLRQPMFHTWGPPATLTRAQPTSQALRTRRKRTKREQPCGVVISNHMPPVRKERAAGNACLWPECGKKFVRSEHLKRHQKTHLNQACECPFCGQRFKGDRLDNRTTHIKLHLHDGGRRKYDERAEAFLESLEQNKRRKGKSKREARLGDDSEMEETLVKPARANSGERQSARDTSLMTFFDRRNPSWSYDQ